MPVARGGIAKRYAEAVFAIARDHGTFDEWSSELARIAGAQEEPDLARVLANPAVGMSAKQDLLAQYLGGLSQEALNLARLLLHKARFALGPRIVEHYRQIVNEYRGIAVAEVASAVPLGAQELEAVAGRLSAMTGRRVVVEPRVDPGIIGGIVARVGDQLIDASIRGRLEALRKQLVT